MPGQPTVQPSPPHSPRRPQPHSQLRPQPHSQLRSQLHPPPHAQPPPLQSAPRFAFQRLDVYVAARELAVLVHSASVQDAELRDQATRASKSCFLALAEGLPHDSPGQRRRYFATATASLCEAVAALDLAAAIGAVAPERASAAGALACRVRRMLTALQRPGARAR
jgi:four helix bundle protein